MKTSITLPYARRLLVRSQQWSSEAKDCFALGWEAAPNAGGQAMFDPKTRGLSCAMLAVQCVYIYIYMVAPPPGTYLFQFYTLFTVFKASPVKGFEGTGIPYSL